MLYSISGIGCNGSQCNCDINGIGRRSRAERKQRRATRKAKRKERRTRLMCKGSVAKKIVLAAPRNAFLSLVRLNFKKLAVKLWPVINNLESKKKLYQKWCKLGGNAKVLEKAIVKAYSKYKRKHKIGEVGYIDTDNMIGLPPLAVLIASAKPILIALAPFIKSLIFKKGEGEPTEQEEQQEQATDEQPIAQRVEQEQQEVQQSSETVEGIGAISPLIWIGLAGAGLYYISKSKK